MKTLPRNMSSSPHAANDHTAKTFAISAEFAKNPALFGQDYGASNAQ